jgi:hypothetical protein
MILLSRTERGRADPEVDADSLGDEARTVFFSGAAWRGPLRDDYASLGPSRQPLINRSETAADRDAVFQNRKSRHRRRRMRNVRCRFPGSVNPSTVLRAAPAW